jgi:glycosyltransferase involved in cell wall biosynthesis
MNKLKIGFDLSQTAFKGGVARYTSELAKHLVGIEDLEMVYFYSSARKPYKGELKNVRSFRLPPTISEVIFNRIRILSIENFLGKIDVYHSSDWLQPKTKAKKVTTYHDVIPLKYPEWSHPKIVEVHKRRLKLVEREIDKVICVSEATKKDLLSVSKIPEDKMVVIYEGIGEEFKPQDERLVEEFREKLDLPQKFILAIGGVGNRRNLDRVKKACEGYDLVITGETISHIPDNQMPLLYRASTVLLYPSLYEGFGLPVLEAMGVGTPVITSNVSSLPEVGGEAALYVNPQDLEDIRKKVKLLMEDKDERERLKRLGFAQAKKFSWDKCAEETAKVYKSAAG